MQWNDFYSDAIQLLCPPGHGVHSVHTAKERKEALVELLYGKNADVVSRWQKVLEDIPMLENPFVLGIPSDCGGGIQRGANWGPLFLRKHLLENSAKSLFTDLGDIRVIPHLLHDKYLNVKTIENCRDALYNGKSDLPVSPLSMAETFLENFYKIFPQKKIFAIGGDHSVSYPLVKTWLENKKNQNINAAVIHFDAHTDLLVERLGIDICFGSWVTQVLDGLNDPGQFIQIGIRSTAKTKDHWEKTFGVKQYWSEDVFKLSPSTIASEMCESLRKKNVTELYVSFDIDALDEKFASATGTPEKEGLEPHQCLIILRELANNFKITGADMVEIAPYVKINEDDNALEPETTLQAAGAISTFLLEQMG